MITMEQFIEVFKENLNGATLNKEETEEFLTSLIGVTGDTYDEVLTTFVKDMKDIGCEFSLTF